MLAADYLHWPQRTFGIPIDGLRACLQGRRRYFLNTNTAYKYSHAALFLPVSQVALKLSTCSDEQRCTETRFSDRSPRAQIVGGWLWELSTDAELEQFPNHPNTQGDFFPGFGPSVRRTTQSPHGDTAPTPVPPNASFFRLNLPAPYPVIKRAGNPNAR